MTDMMTKINDLLGNKKYIKVITRNQTPWENRLKWYQEFIVQMLTKLN